MPKSNSQFEGLDSILNSEVYKKQNALLEEKYKTVLEGENVIHIDYYGGLIGVKDLEAYKTVLNEQGLELSSFDKSGVMYNSLEDYTNMVYLALSSEISKNIAYGVAGNIVWEGIKSVIKQIYTKCKFKKINKLSGGKITKKDVTFGIRLSIDENTKFDFRLDNNFDEDTLDKSLDKTIQILTKENSNPTYKHPKFLYYDHEKEIWVAIDVMEDIRIKHFSKLKKNKKRKKRSKKK